jgi:hypothetical protein
MAVIALPPISDGRAAARCLRNRCTPTLINVRLSDNDNYFLSADGMHMLAGKDQALPALKYFK